MLAESWGVEEEEPDNKEGNPVEFEASALSPDAPQRAKEGPPAVLEHVLQTISEKKD